MAQRCNYKIGTPAWCNNRTSNPTGLCYAHEHTSVGTTPGGQYVQRRGNGPLGLQMKLAREERVPFPPDSLHVPGYPYFGASDLRAYLHFRESGDEHFRPPSEVVLEKFPIEVVEVDGGEIDGNEVGIYGGDDTLHTFNLAVPVDQRSATPMDGVRMMTTEAGSKLMVRRGQPYQVVRIDEDVINSARAALD